MNQSVLRTRRIKLLFGYLELFTVNACIFTWSVLSLIFYETFPEWSSAQLGLNSSILFMSSAVSGLLVPAVLRKLTVRNAMIAGGALLLAGWGCQALLFWFPNIVLSYIGFFLIGYAIGHLYPLIGHVLNAWYPDRQGVISGSFLFVSGVGAIFVGIIEQWMANTIGLLGLCVFFAVASFGIAFACGITMQLPGEVELPLPQVSVNSSGDMREIPIREALHTLQFWKLFGWLTLISAVGSLTINNAANIFEYYHAPATAGMLIMLFNGAGSQLVGIAIDRFRLYKSLAGVSLISLLSCGLLLVGHFLNRSWLVLLGTLINGVIYGCAGTVKFAGAATIYGNSHLTSYFGVFNLCIIPASFLGPYISGWLQMGGNGYASSFVLMLITSFISLVFIFKDVCRDTK